MPFTAYSVKGIIGNERISEAHKTSLCGSSQESTTLCMLTDTCYQSNPLVADISIDMTEEEREIARSTPCGWPQPVDKTRPEAL